MKRFLFIIIPILTSYNVNAFQILTESKFLNFSDVHFDPFYDTSLVKELVNTDYTKWENIFSNSKMQNFGTYGKDSDYKLLISTLEDMKERIPNPDFIIITGDFMSHNFNENFEEYSEIQNDDALHDFIHKTMKFVTALIYKHFPSTTIFPMLGNDDSDCNNYMVQPGGAFLKMLSEIWYPLTVKKGVDENYIKTFSEGGYCIVNFPQSFKYKMLILNSIFFSPYYKDSCGNPFSKPGDTELKWMEKTLKQCKSRNQKVWMSYHISPGIDIYGTVTNKNDTCEKKIVNSWKQTYTNKFLKIIRKYYSTIIANFAGHFHRDDFRIIHKKNLPVSYIHITPSISPVYYNNPAYQIVTYDKSNYALINYQTYFLNLNFKDSLNWRFEYDFKSTYNQASITPYTLNKVYLSIQSDSSYKKSYIKYYTANEINSFANDYGNWFYNWCGIGNLTNAGYADCLCKSSFSLEKK